MSEELEKAYAELQLALRKYQVNCLKYQKKETRLSILISFSSKEDLPELKNLVLSMQRSFASANVHELAFFVRNEGATRSSCLQIVKLPQSDIDISNKNKGENNSRGIPLKERVKSGDGKALKSLLDISLASRDIESFVSVEEHKIGVNLQASEPLKANKMAILLIVKRQLFAHLHDQVKTVEIVCLDIEKQVLWTDTISKNLKDKKYKRRDESKNMIFLQKVSKHIQDRIKNSQFPQDFIIPGVISGVLLTGFASYWASFSTEVPNVVGQDLEYARGIIAGQQINLEITEKIDENLKEGQIIRSCF